MTPRPTKPLAASARPKNLVGARVRALREALGLYQDELARRLRSKGHPLGRVQVVKLEGGTRFVSDAEVMALAEILGATPHALLGFTPKDSRKRK